MDKYIISCVATKKFIDTNGQLPTAHAVQVSYCNNRSEAKRKGYELLEEQCPTSEGWGNYHVIVVEDR